VLVTASTLLARPTQAGGRPYAFTQGVDSLSESSVEVESWITEEKSRDPVDPIWDWWLGPVVGMTDQLEAGLFTILVQPPDLPPAAPGAEPSREGLSLAALRLQVSYLLAPRGTWPVDVRMRLEAGAPLAATDGGSGAEGLNGSRATFWYLAMLGRDFGPLNLTLNAGAWLAVGEEAGADEFEAEPYVRYALGASLEVLQGLRVGGEMFGDAMLSEGAATLLAGPALGWGSGRFWVSAALGFGLTDESPRHRGRLVLGVLF
jgi:hypothetical protein